MTPCFGEKRTGNEEVKMSGYYLILIWIAAIAVFAFLEGGNLRQEEMVAGRRRIRFTPVFAVIAFLPVIIWAGFRPRFADTGAYMSMYKKVPSSLGSIPSYAASISKDKGFAVLTALIRSVFGSNVHVYFLILAMIQGLLLLHFFRKYSEDFVFALFVFVASTDYYSWMFNGIRQFVAVTICLASTGFVLKKKFVPAILLILLASTMHASALLMIPVIFIVQGKAWNFRTVLCILLSVIIVLYVGRFTNLLDTLLSDTQYKNVVSDWKSWDDTGTSGFRVAVYSVPTVLSIIGLRFIREADDPVINLACNMAVISTGLYIVSMFTSGIFIGRLPIYTSLFATGILLPWEIDNMFTELSARLVKVLAVLAYLMFYYYQMHMTWHAI